MSKHLIIMHFLIPLLTLSIKLIPYFLIMVLFTILYIVMPYTKVKVRSGIIGAIIAGILFQIVQIGYIHFQIGVSRYNAIYGSFAAIPLFILWLQLSWLIVLFGAKITFAIQNIDLYEFEDEITKMSQYSRRLLSILIICQFLQENPDGQITKNESELSVSLKIPLRLVRTILLDLMNANLINTEIKDKSVYPIYKLSKEPEDYTIAYINESIDKLGQHFPVQDISSQTEKIVQANEKFFDSLAKLPSNVLVKHI